MGLLYVHYAILIGVTSFTLHDTDYDSSELGYTELVWLAETHYQIPGSPFPSGIGMLSGSQGHLQADLGSTIRASVCTFQKPQQGSGLGSLQGELEERSRSVLYLLLMFAIHETDLKSLLVLTEEKVSWK